MALRYNDTDSIDSINVTCLLDDDEYFEPTTEQLLKLWEEAQKEFHYKPYDGKFDHKYDVNKKIPSNDELKVLWKDTVSEYKQRTLLSPKYASHNNNYFHEESEKNITYKITADELKAAFNQSFEDYNSGKKFRDVMSESNVNKKLNNDRNESKSKNTDSYGLNILEIFSQLVNRK